MLISSSAVEMRVFYRHNPLVASISFNKHLVIKGILMSSVMNINLLRGMVNNNSLTNCS